MSLCWRCGREISDDANYCPYCTTSQGKSEELEILTEEEKALTERILSDKHLRRYEHEFREGVPDEILRTGRMPLKKVLPWMLLLAFVFLMFFSLLILSNTDLVFRTQSGIYLILSVLISLVVLLLYVLFDPALKTYLALYQQREKVRARIRALIDAEHTNGVKVNQDEIARIQQKLSELIEREGELTTLINTKFGHIISRFPNGIVPEEVLIKKKIPFKLDIWFVLILIPILIFVCAVMFLGIAMGNPGWTLYALAFGFLFIGGVVVFTLLRTLPLWFHRKGEVEAFVEYYRRREHIRKEIAALQSRLDQLLGTT